MSTSMMKKSLKAAALLGALVLAAGAQAGQVVKMGSINTFTQANGGYPASPELVNAWSFLFDDGIVLLGAQYKPGTALNTTNTQWVFDLDGNASTGFTFQGYTGWDALWNARASDFAAGNQSGATYTYDQANGTVQVLVSSGLLPFSGVSNTIYANASYRFDEIRSGGMTSYGIGTMTAPVPEPASAALLALGLGAMAMRRRRHPEETAN